MDLNCSDFNGCDLGARTVPFDIDLNETPLSSPRDSVAGNGVSPAVGGGKGKGAVLGLDMNALPTEAAAEETAVNFGLHSIPAGSSIANRINSPVNYPNFIFGGNQKPSFVDSINPRVNFLRNIRDLNAHSVFGGRNLATDYPVNTISFRNQSEKLFLLEKLRKFMLDSHGILLEDGWSVEFLYYHNSRKPCVVYCSPDGHKFESEFDVARHIGLMPNRRFPGYQNRYDGFSFGQHSILSDRTKNEFRRVPESRDVDPCTSSNNSHYKDGFPVQFAEFFVLNLGEIDPRPSYHCTSQIWPVGYKSSWHDKITGSIFDCNVSDGGENGPVFKVQRHPCTSRSIPIGSTILSRPSRIITPENKKPESTFDFNESEDIEAEVLFSDPSPPNLEFNVSEGQPKTPGAPQCNSIKLDDDIGEFLVEGKSSSSVWKMVAERLVHICREMYKQNCVCEFSCRHSYQWCSSCIIYDTPETSGLPDSLSKFCHMYGPFDVPRCIDNSKELSRTCETLGKWLEQDRFGLDVDFVQEMIERLPGAHSFSDYIVLNSRPEKSKLQTVGNGFLEAKREFDLQSDREMNCKAPKEKLVKDLDLSPPGKPLGSKLPSGLVGDVLQSLELLWQFSEVLGLEQTLSFKELEEELIDSGMKQGDPSSEIGVVGENMYKAHRSLLNVLLREWQSKLAEFADPMPENGEPKSKKKRKKGENSTISLKPMLDSLPLNDLTWPELARRYFLFILPSEVYMFYPEAASRESRRAFHCLYGDSRALYGPLPGVAVMEAGELFLAEATKQIFGPLTSTNDNLNVELNESVTFCPNEELKSDDTEVPKWAEALYDVKKLPTNVGAKIRTRVYNALALDPPEWAATILKHSISKDVYKGNASGPTKRAVLSVLAKVCGEPQQPKPQPKPVKKKNKRVSLSDAIMRLCRNVLRSVLSDDEEKVFCNLMGRTLLNTLDTDEEFLLGFPTMVSRPLDFRIIDLRLAFGTYRGSHQGFVEDVREVWNHIRTAYSDQTEIRDLADKLSQKFETLYEQEILTLVEQLEGDTNPECLSPEAKSKIESLIEQVGETPAAPWEEVCRVCGLDKDDKNVLLCDKCNSGYHMYCLDPPLEKVPSGNWYCPSCKSSDASRVSREYGKRRHRGEFTHAVLESISRLIREMEVKDYWDYGVDKRICLLKLLGDEVLNSSCIHENMDQCVSASIDLQQKLRSLTTELRNLKVREEFCAEKAVNRDDTSPTNGSKKSGKDSGDDPVVNMTNDSDSGSEFRDSQPKKIHELQDSIAGLELELQKVSIRKDPLGKDSSGRSYWIFHRPDSLPFVIVDAPNRERFLSNFNEITKSVPVVSQIEEIIKWLREKDPIQIELIESLMRWLIHLQNQPSTSGPSNSNPNSLKTRALMELEKNFGPCFEQDAKASFGKKMWRCKCLEPIWLSRHHCQSCHCSFSTRREIEEHKDRKCSPEVLANVSKGKGITGTEQRAGSSKVRKRNPDNELVGFPNDMKSPFDFDEICAKFVVKSSNKELVKEIGLLGSNGVPSLIPSLPPNLTDPALTFISSGKDNFIPGDKSGDNLSKSVSETVIVTGRRCVKRSLSSKTCSLDIYKDLEEIGRLSDQSWLRLWYSRPGNDVSVIREASLRPLVGKGAQILRQLKVCLLDIDAALPREAIKLSVASSGKRCSWRAFVKSAKSVSEMVQATIVFENMIKSEFLRNEWWYWSSVSAAAKIANLSSLALRIYTLDAAILYDKPCNLSPEAMLEVGDKSDNDSGDTAVTIPKPTLKTRNAGPTDNGKPQTRSGKKRKELG